MESIWDLYHTLNPIKEMQRLQKKCYGDFMKANYDDKFNFPIFPDSEFEVRYNNIKHAIFYFQTVKML